jgi:drug/metabolite transporter (DMT)-like permease
MRIAFAYISVILLWATTPLAIKWSAEGAGFVFGAASRMLIGLACVFLILLVRRQKLPFHTKARRTYLAVSLQIFGAMLAVYWASRLIPSGWISVIFGLTPFITALMAAWILKEKSLSTGKIFSYLLGTGGLALMFSSAMEFSQQAIAGMLGVLLAASLHAASAVWVKKINAQLPATKQVAGGLLFAMPLYLVCWYLLEDAHLPDHINWQAAAAIVYLGIVATTFGFAMYYYVLTHLPATKVAFITILSPVMALYLGYTVNHEVITRKVMIGTGLILTALLLHQFFDRRIHRHPQKTR